MNSVVIYDSNYGNTEQIAQAIAQTLGCQSAKVDTISPATLVNFDLLIVGSPINGWQPTAKIKDFLNSIVELKNLGGVKAAAFDTRVKLFIHGDAAGKISKALEQAGAKIISKPEAFYVKGSSGPLLEGEIQKAVNWANNLKER